MFGPEFAPQRRVLDGVRAFMRERRTPPGFPPVLLRQPSINLYCRVAIPMVLGDSVNAVWELGQLIHVVGMFFEQAAGALRSEPGSIPDHSAPCRTPRL